MNLDDLMPYDDAAFSAGPITVTQMVAMRDALDRLQSKGVLRLGWVNKPRRGYRVFFKDTATYHKLLDWADDLATTAAIHGDASDARTLRNAIRFLQSKS